MPVVLFTVGLPHRALNKQYFSFWYVQVVGVTEPQSPVSQSLQDEALPSGLYFPLGQVTHPVAPEDAFACCPAGQVPQDIVP